jgi:glyoxylase-like metal-dependent hydrolase (beta-lactamase superfamily II)
MDRCIETIECGQTRTNCHLVEGPGGWVVVDPGIGPDDVIRRVADSQKPCAAVLITHAHFDHIGGVDALRDRFDGVEVIAPSSSKEMFSDANLNFSVLVGMTMEIAGPDRTVDPGDVLAAGGLDWQVLDVAGHSPDGTAYYCASLEAVFTGDSLMAGTIGRTDLPGSHHAHLVEAIQRNLYTLPARTRVYSGHGPASTIEAELRDNPHVGRL